MAAERVRIIPHLPIKGWKKGVEIEVELTPSIIDLAAKGAVTIGARLGVPRPPRKPAPTKPQEVQEVRPATEVAPATTTAATAIVEPVAGD